MPAEHPIRPIGGEADCGPDSLYSCITDSGRSSLRLILQSGFRDRKFLLPDYLCKVIPETFDHLGVAYGYYRIKPDLTADLDSVKRQDFDVLYLINFFGQHHPDYRESLGGDPWIIEDCVFEPIVEPPQDARKWIGFNSFRKISRMADGSILRSTFPLSAARICQEEAVFPRIKYRAKQLKHEYLHTHTGSEEQYLSAFNEGEAAIDRQDEVYAISNRSLMLLLEFYRNMDAEYRARRANSRLLDSRLNALSLRIQPAWPSFYVLAVDRRNELRAHLYSQRIFLPVHWPAGIGPGNELYDRVISVPVDSRYDERDMLRVARAIAGFHDLPAR